MGRNAVVGDRRGERGLSPSPWVAVELRAGTVIVDDKPVRAVGSANDRYHAALQQIAVDVAAPLDRPVGVSVSDLSGGVSHLAVDPDGTVVSIAELVRAAHATVPLVLPPVLEEPEPAAAPPRRRSRRPLVAIAAALLVVAGATLVVPLIGGRDGDVASSTIGSDLTPVVAEAEDATTGGAGAGSLEERPGVVTAVAHRVISGRVIRPRIRLAATVVSTAPRQLTVSLATTIRPVLVELRAVAADGHAVVRRLRLGPERPGSVVLTDVAAGRATWRVTAPRAFPDAGWLAVMAPQPEVVATSTTASPPAGASTGGPSTGGAPSGGAPSGGGQGTAKGGSSGGGGSGGGSGQPTADPVVPIDPDDQ
jgi:hypothetical protein